MRSLFGRSIAGRREPAEVNNGYCAGCKQFATLYRVDSWRYRCNDCIAREALEQCTARSKE